MASSITSLNRINGGMSSCCCSSSSSSSSLPLLLLPRYPPSKLSLLTSNRRFHSSTIRLGRHHLSPPRAASSSPSSSSSVNGFPFQDNLGKNGDLRGGRLERVQAGIKLVLSVLPGGSWWRLDEQEKEVGIDAQKSASSAIYVLRRMWMMVAGERWIIFAASAALVTAAVCLLFSPLSFTLWFDLLWICLFLLLIMN